MYRTTPMSARKIAKRTGVSIRGFYDYLQTWHKDLVCERKGIPYEEGKPVDWSSVRKYNPDTAAKYADAIARLKEGGLTMAKVAAQSKAGSSKGEASSTFSVLPPRPFRDRKSTRLNSSHSRASRMPSSA